MTGGNGNRALVVRLLKQGLSHKDVAARTGLALGTVSSYAQWGREKGLLERRTKARADHLIEGLPAHVVDWLHATTPTGAHVTDTIRALLIDAYFEENSDADK